MNLLSFADSLAAALAANADLAPIHRQRLGLLHALLSAAAATLPDSTTTK